MSYTSWNIKRKPAQGRQCLSDRLEHARRLRALLSQCGLNFPDAAKHLHVSLRTLQNWMSGRHQIPPTVFRLLRLERFLELPGSEWAGWFFTAGGLVTPEGRRIEGYEASWWSLMVRRSQTWHVVSQENRLLRNALAASASVVAENVELRERLAAGTPPAMAAGGGRRAAPPLDLSSKHFGTPRISILKGQL